MVKLQTSRVYVNDPVDAWNKELSIGPAEQAVRSQFPYVYNRSGNVILWDDFENQTIKPYLYAGGTGTCNRSASKALFGDFSMKFVTGNVAGDGCCAQYDLNNFREGKVGAMANLMTNDVQIRYVMTISYYDGSTKYVGRVVVDVPSGNVYYGYPTSTTLIDTVSWYTSGSRDLWMPIKLVVDLNNRLFDTLYIARNEIDMSSVDLYTIANTTQQHMNISISPETKQNAAYTVYMDNVIITDNEP